MDAKLNLSRRKQLGKQARNLTDQGKVLGNIYAKGEDSIAVFGDLLEVDRIVKEAGKNHPINITLDDGKEVMVLVHDVERDNITRRMHHVTFQTIHKGEKVVTEVPIRQIGEAPAVRTGMIIVTLLDRVEIEATPSKIPEELEVSVEGLKEDGDQVSLRDITIPDEVELMADPEQPVAKVEIPRAQIDEEEDEEEVDEGEVPSEHGGDDDDSAQSGDGQPTE